MLYPQQTMRKKYPFGRKIVISGETLLEDIRNPIADNMEIGIDFRDLLIKWDYDYDDGYWGKPGVQDIFDPQDILNHRVNAITNGINRLNHGIRRVSAYALKNFKGELEKFANWIGLTIPVKHPDDVSVDYGPQMPSQVWEELYHTEQFMDVVMDKTDILSGQFPKGSPPMGAVSQLASMGMMPINMIVKHYAEALQEMARTILRLMIDFVPDETRLRIVDDKRHYQFLNWDQLKKEAAVYDIYIDVDSMLATSRQEKLNEALQLYEGNIVDRQAVLEEVDYPGKYEVMNRVSEINLLKQGLEQAEQDVKWHKGQLSNLAQNYNRLQIELEKERMKNNGDGEE
jgi:hypothetical protein